MVRVRDWLAWICVGLMVISVAITSLAHAAPPTLFAPTKSVSCHGDTPAPSHAPDHQRPAFGMVASAPCCAGASFAEFSVPVPLLREAILTSLPDALSLVLYGRSVAPSKRPPRAPVLS